MSLSWISCSERLPPAGVLVLVKYRSVHLPSGYGMCIASIVYGISKKTRSLMKQGVIPDPVDYSFCRCDGYTAHKRSDTICFGDEYGNNTVPYEWHCHNSSMDLFGQDVYKWCPLD